MDALDGNAIAAPLFEHFGVEMTTARGSCAHCGSSAVVAELAVYVSGPGTVVRCRSCGGVVIVLVAVADTLRVDASMFGLDDAPTA
jgi:Family of unknown function (DUF6510)